MNQKYFIILADKGQKVAGYGKMRGDVLESMNKALQPSDVCVFECTELLWRYFRCFTGSEVYELDSYNRNWHMRADMIADYGR